MANEMRSSHPKGERRAGRSACPVRRQALEALRAGQYFAQAIRRLRREMNACQRCPEAHGCPVVVDFHSAIEQAIEAVNEEWGIGRSLHER